MRVVFLDIDGVLNYRNCPSVYAGYSFVEEKQILLLKEIVETTGAFIVLSSSWRQGWYDKEEKVNSIDVDMFDALEEKLDEYGLVLWDKTKFLGHRDREIEEWLNSWAGEPIESYVILDDLNGRYLKPCSSHLVRTSFVKGLEPKHIKKAIAMLIQEEKSETN